MPALFLKTFVVTTIVFFLFFYSTPYWTGAEMEDLMHNGIYRAFYVFCSKTGHWAYQLIERLSAGLCSLLGKKAKSDRARLAIYTLLSLCLLAGSIIGLNQLYEHLFQDMFAAGDGIDVSSEHTLLSRFSDLFIFFKLIAGYFDGTFLGFFRALGRALLLCMAYFWGTIVFFSFLYGLLSQKVVPLFKKDDPHPAPVQSEEAGTLLQQCVDGVRGAVEKICYLRYFKVPGTLLPFLLIVAVYSLIQVLLGREAEAGSLVMDIVDSTGVIDLVMNFILEFIIGKILYYLCVPVYRALPEGAQAAIQNLSDRGERWVQREKDRRAQWARENDLLHNSDAGSTGGHSGFDPLHKMDLNGTRNKK